MSDFIMLVGPSYSGKSTVAERLAKLPYAKVFSSDEIRKELYGDAGVQKNPGRVFDILHSRIVNWLKASSKNCAIYDATNLTAKRRISFLKFLSQTKIDIHKTCIVVTATLEDIEERMKHRERVVPKEVIYRQLCNFQYPGYYEGWDGISKFSTSSTEDCSEWFFKIIDKADHMPHDNPHHSLDVGGHMRAADEYASEHFPELSGVVKFAIGFHDMGKVYTKKFENGRGQPTEIAHYLGHQNFGAYIMATILNDHDNVRQAALLVQWHMAHFIENEKRLEKIYNWMKQEGLYESLKALEECDEAAH